jgi:metal-responsive CopG/Arc/MetJ family transcriptional regulator
MQDKQIDRAQVNVRVEPELLKLLDEKRTQLLAELGSIPSRSDVIRMALESYLRN